MTTSESNGARVARRFYDAFSRHDAATMCACYGDRATFADPAFGQLDATRTRAMWTMLVGRAPDLSIHYQLLSASDTHAEVRWIALYTFSATGRHVRNVIRASLDIDGDHIIRHRDKFNMQRWAAMALSPAMVVLAALPPVRAKIRSEARKTLDAYQRDPSA
jgi:ketosteroid isomerase-like protein